MHTIKKRYFHCVRQPSVKVTVVIERARIKLVCRFRHTGRMMLLERLFDQETTLTRLTAGYATDNSGSLSNEEQTTSSMSELNK